MYDYHYNYLNTDYILLISQKSKARFVFFRHIDTTNPPSHILPKFPLKFREIG